MEAIYKEKLFYIIVTAINFSNCQFFSVNH